MPPGERIPGDLSTHTRFSADSGSLTEGASSTQDRAHAPFPDSIPIQFGHFEILELIGHGGMGIVYKARDPQLDRLVAIKQLIAGAAAHPEHRERFLTEARAIAQLDHRHIVPIYDFNLNAGQPYFVMKYLDGGSLSQKRAELAGNTRAVVAVIAKVARAVHHAHEHGILHRDLKPSNILLDEQGEPLVGDFGLAKLLYAGDDLTYTGVVLGTPTYMPPEQRAGRVRDLSFGCDIWALGITLRELVTGARPNESGAKLDVTPANNGSPAAVTGSSIADPGLAAIIERCLQPEPANRYPTAAALADDLEQWLRGQFTPPKRRMSRSRRAFLLAGVGAVAALAGGTALWSRSYYRQDAARGLRRELDNNGCVDLLGPDGRPIWHDVRFGTPEMRPQQIEGMTGLFISDLQKGVVDLLGETGQEHIKLHAEVQLTASRRAEFCEAGIYVGRSQQAADTGLLEAEPIPKIPVECFLYLLVRRPPIDKVQTDLKNLEWERCLGWAYCVVEKNKPSFLPKANEEKYRAPIEHWHTLTLDLGLDGLVGYKDDGRSEYTRVQRSELLGASADAQKKAPSVDLRRVAPTFKGTQAVGIYVDGGEAVFRRIWLERVAKEK